MCGRFLGLNHPEGPLAEAIDELQRKTGKRLPSGELSPGSEAALVARNRRGDTAPFYMKWGFSGPQNKLIFNTRSESAAEKPLFAASFAQRRCIIPAKGYFEWARKSSEKTKYSITRADGALLYLAGIYRLEATGPVFSVLTKAPCAQVSFLHDRMPVILTEEQLEEWIAPDGDAMALIRNSFSDLQTMPMEPVNCSLFDAM